MNNELSDQRIPCARSDFKKAVQRYGRVVSIAALCAFALFGLCLGLALLAVVWLQPHRPASPFAKAIELQALAVVSAVVSIAFLTVVVRRARRNPTLHCVYCDQSVADGDANGHVLVTGMCPHCRRHLFEGSLATSDEAVQRFEKLKRDISGHLRFAVIACVVGLVPAYAILLWMTSTAPQTREINWLGLLLLPPAMFLLLIGGMWVAARGDIKRAQRHADAMQDADRNGPIQ